MNVAYLRVSSLEQKKGRSIESQEQGLLKFAEQNNFKIDKFFKDEGWSGAVLERPELDNLRDEVQEGSIDKILLYHPDRLSRKQVHQLLLLDEFEKAGVEVLYSSQPETNEQGQETKLVMKTINSMVSELERLRIADRVRRGRRNWAEKGFVMTGKAPYGFRYVKANRKKGKKGYFEHHSEEIKVVKKILNWALEGKSDPEIIEKLYEKGIKTRKGKDKWAKSTIHKILSTNLSTYAGTWYYNKYKATKPENPEKKGYKRTEKSSRVLNDKEEWVEVELPEHLAIITKEQAAKIRKIKKENKAVKKGNIKYFYLLQGRIYCRDCGGRNWSDCFHQVEYYRCADKKRKWPTDEDYCEQGSVKARPLEKAVWRDLTKLITNPEVLKEQAEDFIERGKTDKVITDQEHARIIKKKAKLQKETERLEEGYTKGLIDDDGLARQKKRIEKEKETLRVEEKEHLNNRKKAKSIDRKELLDDIERLSKEAKEVLVNASREEKKQALKWLGVKVHYAQYKYEIKGSVPVWGFTQLFSQRDSGFG